MTLINLDDFSWQDVAQERARSSNFLDLSELFLRDLGAVREVDDFRGHADQVQQRRELFRVFEQNLKQKRI